MAIASRRFSLVSNHASQSPSCAGAETNAHDRTKAFSILKLVGTGPVFGVLWTALYVYVVLMALGIAPG